MGGPLASRRGSSRSLEPTPIAHREGLRRRSSGRSCARRAELREGPARDRLGLWASPPRPCAPVPSPPSTLTARRASAARRDRALRAPRRPGSFRACRRQEAEPDRAPWTPGHRRSLEESPGAPAGDTCTWRSTTTPDSASPQCRPDETADSALAFLSQLVRSLRLARHLRRARAHRQRHLLQTPLRPTPARCMRSPSEKTRAYRPRTDGRGRALHPHAARALGVRLLLRQRVRERLAALRPALDFLRSLPSSPRTRRSRRSSASTTSLGHTTSHECSGMSLEGGAARTSSSGATRSRSSRRRLHRAVGWHPAHACSSL